MHFTIRKVRVEDIPQIQYVARTSWNHTYEGIIPLPIQESFLNSAYSDERMLSRVNNSNLYIAEVEGKVVGFANFSPLEEEGEVELGAIYLLPDYQGAGIGTALLEEGLKEMEEVKKVYIYVEKENKSGTTFYQAKGFEIVTEFEEDFEGHTLQTVRMVLKL